MKKNQTLHVPFLLQTCKIKIVKKRTNFFFVDSLLFFHKVARPNLFSNNAPSTSSRVNGIKNQFLREQFAMLWANFWSSHLVVVVLVALIFPHLKEQKQQEVN